MNDKDKEILLIAAEECAEVTQAISKVLRFGLESEWKGVINKKHLSAEVGDLLCMVALMVDHDLIDENIMNTSRYNKRERLETWSSIFGVANGQT